MKTLRFFLVVLFIFTAVPMMAGADPIEDCFLKWDQQPDMDQGISWRSVHQVDGPVVADDFESNGLPILGFHWWGSYLDGQGPDTGMYKSFEISFHPDVPVGPDGFSVPGQPYQHQMVSAQESFFGTTNGGVDVYEYWALLSTPWEEVAGETYWVDFAYDNMGDQPIRDWGWHESFEHWNDFAVTTDVSGAGGNPHTGTWELVGDGRRDMAFEICTVPEPSTMLLLGAGLIGFAGFGRKKFKK